MNKKFFYIESVQTWVNLMHVEAIFRSGQNWTLRTQSGQEIPLSDTEYWKMTDIIRTPFDHDAPHRPEEKKD